MTVPPFYDATRAFGAISMAKILLPQAHQPSFVSGGSAIITE